MAKARGADGLRITPLEIESATGTPHSAFQERKRPGKTPAVSVRVQSSNLRGRPLSWGKLKTIGVHHLVPGGHEVFDELFFRVRRTIDFRERAELRV